MSFNLASAILRGQWVIDPSFARSQIPFLVNFINGTTQFDALTDEERAALEPVTYSVVQTSATEYGASTIAGEGPKPDKSKYIRVIPVVGVMLKYSQSCGPRGTVDIGNSIAQAGNDPDTDAVVLKFDTPGGMVSGIQTFSQKIAEVRKKKPVVAFVDDGLCASAGYWAACACNEIVASQNTDTIGSIGVFITLADYKGYAEKQGLRVHEIYADQSTGKNSGYREAMKGNYKKIKADDLNPIADIFINTVKENRKGKLNAEAGDPFKGDTYMAERALEIGLIDSIGDMDFAINRAAELSNGYTANLQNTLENLNLTNTDMKMKILSSQAALAALLAVSFAQGETEKEVELTDAHLATINSKLGEYATAMSTATASINEKNATIANQAAKITALEKETIPPAGDAAGEKTEGPEWAKNEDPFYSETDAALAQLKASMGPAIPTGTK